MGTLPLPLCLAGYFASSLPLLGWPFTLSVIADVGQILATIVNKLARNYRDNIKPVLIKYNILRQRTG